MMTDAEMLLQIANVVMSPRNKLVILDGIDIHQAETIALAIRFSRLPVAMKLRAMLEEWTRHQIIREVY